MVVCVPSRASAAWSSTTATIAVRAVIGYSLASDVLPRRSCAEGTRRSIRRCAHVHAWLRSQRLLRDPRELLHWIGSFLGRASADYAPLLVTAEASLLLCSIVPLGYRSERLR